MKPLVLSLALLLAACRPERPPDTAPAPAPRPSIYITRSDSYRTIEGNIIWILEYTINGETQNPGFDSREDMEKYREYLDTIGDVYQRETGE
jgi:hypothetical protein